MAYTCTCDSGYMAPEYAFHGLLSTKADVFSFGVLVLETVTGHYGRQAKDMHGILYDYVKRNWLEGALSNVFDPRLDADSVLMTKFIEIGLLCIQEDALVRPTMEEVVDMLLGTLSPTLHVLEMRARMNPRPRDTVDSQAKMNPEPLEPEDSDENEYEGSDTGEVEEFILELCPR